MRSYKKLFVASEKENRALKEKLAWFRERQDIRYDKDYLSILQKSLMKLEVQYSELQTNFHLLNRKHNECKDLSKHFKPRKKKNKSTSDPFALPDSLQEMKWQNVDLELAQALHQGDKNREFEPNLENDPNLQ